MVEEVVEAVNLRVQEVLEVLVVEGTEEMLPQVQMVKIYLEEVGGVLEKMPLILGLAVKELFTSDILQIQLNYHQ